ncbi:TetR family transcriptional regulator [Brevibacillus reuszeri]|uniref:TetR family transcriptional regulator n=1 Tax=Brevibacillus reuszeri TaxID=54915 RepID=UPI0028A232E4|nr:TetR family transcriptional regulator [Brevibacillus reuszeri]
MARSQLQIKRMLQYFVDATVEIIEEEGIEQVSARKIGQKAGYTGSTIYNYFEELSHLIFFASMRFATGYLQELPHYLERGQTYLEKYVLSWECFCKHSFAQPHIYHALFIANLGKKPEDILAHYFSIYSSDLIGLSEEIKPLLYNPDLTSRSLALLKLAKKERELDDQTIEDVNEMTVLIWEGMLTTILNKRREMDPEEAVEKTMKHIRNAMTILENSDPR